MNAVEEIFSCAKPESSKIGLTVFGQNQSYHDPLGPSSHSMGFLRRKVLSSQNRVFLRTMTYFSLK